MDDSSGMVGVDVIAEWINEVFNWTLALIAFILVEIFFVDCAVS